MHMTTSEPQENERTNLRLLELMEQSGLKLAPALALFNVGLVKKYSMSAFQAYLSARSARRWRRLHPDLLAHAEKTIGKIRKAD